MFLHNLNIYRKWTKRTQKQLVNGCFHSINIIEGLLCACYCFLETDIVIDFYYDTFFYSWMPKSFMRLNIIIKKICIKLNCVTYYCLQGNFTTQSPILWQWGKRILVYSYFSSKRQSLTIVFFFFPIFFSSLLLFIL